MTERAALPSEALGRQVKKWRGRRKLTGQDLANRAAEIGASTLTRTAISKIEVAQRGVSLDEWLQLAHVLAVPPPLLFVDLESGEQVEVAPGVVLHPWLAWKWILGEEPPVMTDRTVTRVEEFAAAKHAIYLYRREDSASTAVQNAASDIRRAKVAANPQREQLARDQYAEALAELTRCFNDMIENQITPPAVIQEWADDMRALGTLKYPEQLEIFEPGQVDGAGR